VLLEAKISSKSRAIPTIARKRSFWAIFVAAMVKLQQFANSEADEIHHRSRAAIQQLTAPVETSKLVLTAHYDVNITSQLAKNI